MTTVASTGNLQNAKPLRSHVTMDRADCPWFSTQIADVLSNYVVLSDNLSHWTTTCKMSIRCG